MGSTLSAAGFSEAIEIGKILEDKNARLSVQLYVQTDSQVEDDFNELLSTWESHSAHLKISMDELFKSLANG